ACRLRFRAQDMRVSLWRQASWGGTNVAIRLKATGPSNIRAIGMHLWMPRPRRAAHRLDGSSYQSGAVFISGPCCRSFTNQEPAHAARTLLLMSHYDHRSFGLTDEQTMMQSSVLELLRRHLPREKIAELDENREFPAEAYAALAEA